MLFFFSIQSAIHPFQRFGTQEAYLGSSKTQIKLVSPNVFPFPHIGCFVCILTFWYIKKEKKKLKNTFLVMFCFYIKRYRIYLIFIQAVQCLVPKRLKTLIMHVSRNVLSFPHTGCFTCIFKMMYVTDSKRLKIHIFGKVFFYSCLLHVFQRFGT